MRVRVRVRARPTPNLAAAEGTPSRGGRHALLEHLDEHARAGHWEGDARVALIDTRVGTILSRIDEVGAEVEQDGHGVEQLVGPARYRAVMEEDHGHLRRRSVLGVWGGAS